MIRKYGRVFVDLDIMEYDTLTLESLIVVYQIRKMITNTPQRIVLLGRYIRLFFESDQEADFVRDYFNEEVAPFAHQLN